MTPTDRKYTREHEWVQINGKQAIVGITNYAQNELGDVVFVDLPETGSVVEANDEMAVVESVKAVSDIYAPVSGKVVKVNEALQDDPELINSDPYKDGWISIIEMSDPDEVDELMSAEEYADFTEGE